MNMWDLHMHTHHSGDSKAPMEACIQSAIQKKLLGICFTDHFDYDYPKDPDLFLLDFDSYYKEYLLYKEKYMNQIELRFGVELGLQPEVIDVNNATTSKYPFDFVIGSTHVSKRIDPYYSEYYQGRTEDQAYREYFESVLENISAPVDFDVCGHIDYVVRYGPNKDAFYSYEKYADVIDEILRTVIQKGKGIEINSGALAKGMLHPNPTEKILMRYKELGGEIITTGADSHVPENVAYGFDRISSILKEVGFKYYTVFSQRKANFLPL